MRLKTACTVIASVTGTTFGPPHGPVEGGELGHTLDQDWLVGA